MIRPHTRRRLLPVVLLVVLLAFGCDSDAEVPDDEDVAATRDEAEGPAGDTPTPTSSPAGDADEGEPEVPEAGDPPSLDGLVSDDELEVARTRQRYWSWLLRHRDTDSKLLEEVVGPDTDIYESLHRLVVHYEEEGLRWEQGTNEVVDVDVLDAQLPNTRVVRVYYHRDEPAQLVDAAGEVHDDLESARRWVEEVWARKDEQSRWRLIDVGDEGAWEEGER